MYRSITIFPRPLGRTHPFRALLSVGTRAARAPNPFIPEQRTYLAPHHLPLQRQIHSTTAVFAQTLAELPEGLDIPSSPYYFGHQAPPPPPPSSTGSSLAGTGIAHAPEEYRPSDLDFEYTSNYDEARGPAPRPPRGRRLGKALDLPRLPETHMPPDGLTRFDWRQRSLSAQPKAAGKRWYPQHAQTRVDPPIPHLQPGELFYEELQRYKDHFLTLLQAEQEEEETLLLQRLKEWPEHRLKRTGHMIDDLGATPFKTRRSTAGAVYQFAAVGKSATTRLDSIYQFKPGTVVFVSRTDPFVDGLTGPGLDPKDGPQSWRRGRIFSVPKGSIRVEFDQPIPELLTGRWRLDVGIDEMSYVKQKLAINSMNVDPVPLDVASYFYEYQALLDPKEHNDDKAVDSEREAANKRKIKENQYILQGTSLRDHILRAFQETYVPYEQGSAVHDNTSALPAQVQALVAESSSLKPTDVDATATPSAHRDATETLLSRNELIRNWAQRYRSEDPVPVEGDPVIALNPSQTRAIAMMLGERLSLVQGPPGTGKTRLIVETIKLLKKHWQIRHPILVCAHTNVAVDNLLDGLTKHGLKAVRVGSDDRIREDLQQHSLSVLVEDHPLWPEYASLQEEKDQLFSASKEDTASTGHRARRLGEIYGRSHSLLSKMRQDVLNSADVVCSTLLSASSFKTREIDFPIVFLDEASMATEPLSLIALMKGSANVAIIGDHKQLPPVIMSEKAQAGGLATSLFERLIHERNVPSIMLDTQYRMHPSISAFPNRAFYNAALKDGTVSPSGQVQASLSAPDTGFLLPGKNMTFVDHEHPESPENKSIANYGDASKVVDIVADLLYCNPDLKASDIGVIAPYAAQIRLISDYLLIDPDRKEAFVEQLGPERAAELENIEVKTVDGFEGREKDVIIFSTVRSNARGNIGFLADWRRLNVGITRAKRALIMVGSARTLSMARTTQRAVEMMPQGGADVWKDFMKHLEEQGMILRAD